MGKSPVIFPISHAALYFLTALGMVCYVQAEHRWLIFCFQGTFADWVGGETEALEGFSWRGGSERDTTGILLWSKPYIKTLPNGEEVG